MSDKERNDEYIFTWKIKNYSACYQDKGKYIQSPNFTISTLRGCEWCLKLYPNSSLIDNFISLFLNLRSLKVSVNSVTIRCYIEVVDEKECILKSREFQNATFTRDSPIRGWPKFFDIHNLEKEMNSWTEDILTLRCRIKMRKRKQTIVGSAACTTICVDRFCADWHVKIPVLSEFSGEISFPVLNLYRLNITLKSVLEELDILIHFKKGQPEVPQKVTFTFFIFDKIGFKLSSKRAVHLCKNDETWKFPEFLTKEMLRNCEVNASQYEFKLKCEVCISKNCTSETIEEMEFVSPFSLKFKPLKPKSAIIDKFQNLLNSKTFSDVTIRGKNDEFPAHKFILRVRSPVFAAMFDQDMIENKTGVVNIADLDGKTLKAFLEYLYTETVNEMDYEVATKLIFTADKYQVPLLVDQCASFLKLIVSVENVCEIIAIADLINCESLKSSALNFIKINAAKILSCEAWTKWIKENMELATYILSKLSAAIGTEYKLI